MLVAVHNSGLRPVVVSTKSGIPVVIQAKKNLLIEKEVAERLKKDYPCLIVFEPQKSKIESNVLETVYIDDPIEKEIPVITRVVEKINAKRKRKKKNGNND